MSDQVTTGAKNGPISLCFLLIVTWIFEFFQISDMDLNYMQEDTFMPYFMQIGRAIASTNSPEKKKTNHQLNITLRLLPEIFTNFIFTKR